MALVILTLNHGGDPVRLILWSNEFTPVIASRLLLTASHSQSTYLLPTCTSQCVWRTELSSPLLPISERLPPHLSWPAVPASLVSCGLRYRRSYLLPHLPQGFIYFLVFALAPSQRSSKGKVDLHIFPDS